MTEQEISQLQAQVLQLAEDNAKLRNDLHKLNYLYLQSLTQWSNGFAKVDGEFISKELGQQYIEHFQIATRNDNANVAFFVKTSLLLDLIYNGNPPADPPPPFVKPSKLQIIFGQKPGPGYEFTLVLVGANDLGEHIYCNDQVLENVWPEISAGSIGHANTILE